MNYKEIKLITLLFKQAKTAFREFYWNLEQLASIADHDLTYNGANFLASEYYEIVKNAEENQKTFIKLMHYLSTEVAEAQKDYKVIGIVKVFLQPSAPSDLELVITNILVDGTIYFETNDMINFMNIDEFNDIKLVSKEIECRK